jgi:hypothetical protein
MFHHADQITFLAFRSGCQKVYDEIGFQFISLRKLVELIAQFCISVEPCWRFFFAVNAIVKQSNHQIATEIGRFKFLTVELRIQHFQALCRGSLGEGFTCNQFRICFRRGTDNCSRQ